MKTLHAATDTLKELAFTTRSCSLFPPSSSWSSGNGAKWLKAGFVEGPLAARKNLDGSISLVSAGPGAIGVEAPVGNQGGARTLTIRDTQRRLAACQGPTHVHVHQLGDCAR